MTRHARLVAAAAIALAMCLGSLALAQQPKKGSGRTRPKPVAVADAAAEARTSDDSDKAAAADAGAGPTLATGAAESTTGDGGMRASPLNPGPGEMPGSGALDGGSSGVDYDRLLSEIAALRTRVAAVGESLFQSRMAVAIRIDGDRGRIARLTLAVDDGIVYTSPPGFRGDESTPIFSRALAPGRHAVTVEVEREDVENVAFRSTQRSRFVVEVARDEQLDVNLRVEDDSSMADLPGKKKGEYDLRVRMKATSNPIKR